MMMDLGPNDIHPEPDTTIPVVACPWGCGDRHPADEVWDCPAAPVDPDAPTYRPSDVDPWA